jgi:hypothetical protein
MPAPSTPAPIDDVISARFTRLVNGTPRAVTFRIHPNVALELIPASHASLGHLVIPPTDEILLWRGLEALMLGRATIT